jgi:hypothetical protein
MQEFRGKTLEGEWWLPGNPDVVFKGLLTINDEDEGTLVFRGTEDHLARLREGEKQPTFFGRLAAKYPYDVTLFDTVLKRGAGRTLPKSINNETEAVFLTNSILISDHIESQNDTAFNGATINLTGLNAWCNLTGFSGRHKNPTPQKLASGRLNISYRERSTKSYDLGSGRTIRFLSQYAGPFYFEHLKQVTLKEKNTIEIIFAEDLSIKHLLQEIHIWQTFITFGLRRPSYIDEIILLIRTAVGFRRVGLIVPGRKSPSEKISASEVLFNQKKLGAKIGKRLKGWRQKYERVDLAVLIFSGVAYQDSSFIHANLLSYLQSLEVLHRELFKADRFPDEKTRKETIAVLRKAVPESLGTELQKEIRESLGYIGAVTLVDRLKALYALYPNSVGPLFRRGDTDMNLLKDVRNFLTHYGVAKIKKEFLYSRDVFVLKEKARLFIEICLLGAMGMSDDEILKLMREFDPYNGWRREALTLWINAKNNG